MNAQKSKRVDRIREWLRYKNDRYPKLFRFLFGFFGLTAIAGTLIVFFTLAYYNPFLFILLLAGILLFALIWHFGPIMRNWILKY